MQSTYTDGILKIVLPQKINSKNATDFEKELFEVKNLDDAEKIFFDAENLNYISSMGLRVILKLLKKYKGVPVIFENTSAELYDVLETSGFTELMKVTKKLRHVDLNSLELLGEGMYGSVYRINEEQILKVFKKVQTEVEMRKVIDVIRAAFTHDIPTIIPFEVVKTDKGFGIVLELLNATLLSTLMHDNPKDFDKYAVEMVELAKSLADAKFEEGTLKNHNDFMTEFVDSSAEFLTEDEITAIKYYIDIVPRRNSGVHCDFHAKNIMIMDGKLLLIDMDSFGCGHPAWDIGGTHRIYQMFPHFSDDITYKLFELQGINLADLYFKMIGFTVDEADRCWQKFFDEYFKDYSEQEKIYLAETAKVYGTFAVLWFALERCHLVKDDPARLQMKIDAARFFLKEMQAVDTAHLIKAFEVWK